MVECLLSIHEALGSVPCISSPWVWWYSYAIPSLWVQKQGDQKVKFPFTRRSLRLAWDT